MSELLTEFEQKFAILKKELKFKTSLEEIDEIFFIRDFISDKGYVSTSLSRQICWRIVDLFTMWYGYLHNIIVPNPGSMVSITESSQFNEQEKAEIMDIMNQFMKITSTNMFVGLTRDKRAEARFIDGAVETWNTLKPKLMNISTRVNTLWKEKAETPTKPQKKEAHYG